MKKIFKGKIKLLIGLTFLALFIFNTIAYSGLATKLAITSEAMFRPNVDIRITNIKLHSAENGAVESYSPKYNVDSTTTGFVLPNTSSKITYEVTVTNYGNVRQTIYKFIKNSISTDGVNIEISNFKPVYSDTSSDYNCTTNGTTANKNCTYKNSNFTIVSNKNYDDDKENEKVFYITFSTTNPNSTPKNVIENYKYKPVYKIDFNANGGQNAPSSIYKVFGESTSLPKETPTRSLYNFTGWSKSSTSTSAEYSAGGLYDLSEDESNIKNIKDVTLYAVWQKKQATIDLNYNIDGTWYYAGYNNKIQTGIKVNGEDKGYLNDFSGTYDYGTNYEIYGFKIDGVTIPYSKKYTVDGTNHLGISFNTINFKVNDTNLGSVTPTQLIVIPGTTYTISNNVITLSDGRIATASPKTITGYTSKFSSYTITPNSTTINTKITATANFTKEANTYTITLDNKSATTAGTTAFYEKYGAGIYLDSALKNVMTTSANPIAKPAKTGYTFKGYYTKENGQGDQIINENGYITDKATNTTYTANATLYAYYKDETKPTLTLTNSSNGNWTNKDVTITLNGADSGSGIKEYQLKYSGSSNAWKKTTAPKDTWSAERNETVYYRVVDNAGNESDAVSTSIRIDKTTPKIELNGAASSSEINNSNNVTIPIKITETASGINNSEFTASDISVLINGTAVNPSTKTLTYNSVSNGIYSYTLTLSGITLNGKVTLEIAAGAVKDIATNSNAKTTLDPSITVSNIYTISLNGNGATTVGTPAIYEKYNTGIYLDSTLTKAMTTTTNPIPTTPSRSYTVSFNANNTGITMPSAITKSYSYSGHYTDATAGTQMINENGYITSSFKNTSYTTNDTLYAHWKAKPSITIPAISKTGYTCSWNTSADGKGTIYNGGDVTDKLNTQTLYARCSANTYTIEYKANGGSGTMNSTNAIFDQVVTISKNTFTKEGYTFVGWTTKSDGTDDKYGWTNWSGTWKYVNGQYGILSNKLVLYAMWTPNTNTKYVVKHYKQKLDGTYPSEADDTDNLTGTTDSSVSPAVKDVKNNSNYIGFTAPSVQTVTISADGSTVVTYKYTRNKYTFTLGSTTGITTTGSTASGSYYYGSTITLKASANTGYTFNGWISSNTNLVANQTNASATFTMPAGNITMTPSTGYASYTVTYDATTNGGSTAKQTASTKYKSLVDLTKKAEKSGYDFVGWNTNKDATSALSSYEMPAKNVTLYAIYKKTLTATFNYYNSKSEIRSVTIYNNATSGSITSPAALGTPSGYTFRHYSTSNVANAAKTIDANSAVVLTGNQTYYASYQKNVTLNFYYHSGTDAYANKQTSTTATGVQYLGYNNAIVNSTVSIPSAVAGSTGYYGTSYKGVTAANSTTPISVNTGTTNYYAYYQATITYYYYNGSAHTTGAGTRTAYSNGTNYVTTASAAPTPSSYDGAAFKGWSYTNDSVNDRNPAYTAMTALYAYYQKTVNATFNYYDGSKAASVIAGNTKTYISKSGGVNTINTNITIPDAAKANVTTANNDSYSYRGVSTSNKADASLVTPTTANTTYYTSYTYVITVSFTANGGTETAPSAVAGTGYMNYSGSKSGINVTMPKNTFTKTGYSFGGWYDSIAKKTYAAGTSATIDSTRSLSAVWNANELTFNDEEKEITYSEASQSFNISKAAGNGTGKYSYSITSGDTNGNFSINGLTISTNKDKVPSVGTYKLEVTAKDENSLKTKKATITIKVNYATITYTASSYEGFYDGSGHTIGVNVTKPTSGATITYSTSLNGTYSSTKPSYTNVGTYTIYFKISAANYNTITDNRTITINITNSVSPTLTAYSGTYDGKPHTIGVTGGSGGTIKYSTDQTNWSTTLPTRTDATTTPVTVYVKVFGDGNHKDTSIISSTITINKKTDVITMSSISTNYTGRKVEATATAESKTTITYTYYNGTTCSGTALSSAPVNVGDYSVKATSAGNNNYKSNSACAAIKINNTNNPTTVSAVTGLKYGSTGNLVTTSNVQGTIYYSVGTELTSSNYKTSGSTSIPTASGKNADTYKIYYYVDATETNYESTKGGPVSVTIGKAAGSISYATKSVTKDYSNTYPDNTLTNPLTKTGDGTITSYLSSNTGVATIDTSGKVTINAAGTTTIKATVTDGTNYTYATKTATYTLIVNQIDNTAKVIPVTGIIYGDSKSMVNVSGVQGTIYYSVGTVLTESNYLSVGSVTIPTSKGRNAGDYNIYYFVKGNSNYKNTSDSVKVTISAKTLSIPVSPNAKPYNGNLQGSGISCPQGSTTSEITSAIDAGTYSQKCTLNSTTNYVWDDTNKTTTPKSISWKIKPKEIAVTWGSTTQFTYNGSGQAPSASATTGIANETMVVTRTTGTTVKKEGSYTSTASCSSVTGGRAKCGNYTLTGNTKSFSIGRATIKTTPSSPAEKSYNGSTQGSGITCPSGSTTGGTTSATNQGTYTQTCTPDGNHKWSDGTTEAIKIKWVIKPVSAIINCNDKIYYNGASQTACSCSGGTIGGTTSAIDAGTYTVSCTPDGNHTAPDNKQWKIKPKEIAVTWGSTTQFTYNGSGQAPSASATTGIANETMVVTRTTGTTVKKEGSYTSTASCSSVTGGRAKCGNYTLTGNTKSFSIGKRNTTCTTTSASKYYNGTELTANSGTCTNLVSGHSATVSASGTITNAGSTANTYKGAVIKNGAAEVTTNYSITGANGTLTIIKVPATNPTLTAYSGTYDGQSHTISVSGGSGGTIQYSTDNKTWSTTKPTRTNVGTTTVYVKVVGDGNHTDTNPISSTITITAQKLPAPTNLTITTAGIVTWSGVSNAIKYQISIDGTNWTDATSGVDYLSKIIASTGTRTVYVRAVGTGNYSTSDNATASTTVYTVTINSNSTTRGKVDTSSYNVIEGATYSTSSNKLSFIGVTTGTTTKTLKTVTATPSTGYYFANWSSASGSISSNATITANFVIIDYKIKYENGDASSGTLPSEQTTHYNETVTLEKNNMSKNQTNLGTVTFNYNGCGNNTTGTGYTTYVPNGWATSNNGTKAYDSGASIKWTRTSNLTLYPSWTSTNHSATFPAPTCTGYTFDGWYTAASGGSKVTSYVGSSAITYYAHWKSNIYELLLNNKKLNDNKTIYLKYGDGVYLNYANNSVSNKMTSTANPISKPKLTKDIPLFSNYIVPKEGEEDKNVPTGTSTVSFTFDGYSYKNSDSQRIKLINSDGYIADTFTNKLFTSNSVADLDIKSLQYNFGTPTKAGYTFEGWFTRPQGDSTTNVLYVPEASGSGNDHNFLENNTDKVYAHWLKNIELVSSNSDWSSSGVTISPKEISKSDSVEGASSETAKIKYQYCLAELGQTCTNYSDIDDINGSITINENGIHDIYYRAVSMFLIKNNSTDSEAITKTIVTPSVKTTVKIDNVQPEVDIVAKKVSTNQVVKSGDWSNDFLKFQFSNIKIGSSGGVIKYCIQNSSTNDSESDSESNDCEPNKLADSSNMISLSETNTKDGEYEIVYKIINSAGEESEIGKYNANIDRVAPVVTIDQTNLDDDTSASPITSPNEQKLDSDNNFTRTFSQNYTTWVKSGYDFKVTVSGESDYQIRVGYNDPDLLSTDSSYKKIPELSEQEDITESGEFSLIENGYRYGVVTVTDAAGNKTTFVFHAQIDDVVPILNITAKDQKGNEIPSGILSKTGLTYTTKIIKSGVSPVKVYSCSVTAADFDPDNLCTPESPVGTGRTGNEFVQKGYANVTSMDRYVRVQGTSSSGLQSEVEADNGIEEGETGREEYNTIHYGRVGTTDIEISVYRTDNSKAVTSRKWVNSKIKFKLTPVSSTSTFKYCTGAGDIKDSGTTKCTPKTAGTTNKLVSSTRTGKFHIAYQATTGGKPGTIHYFNAYVDVVKPTLKITAYKLNSAGNGADGGALTSATNGGPDNLSGNNIKGGAWRDYYYFFSLSGSGDTGGSGIKSMVWEYNNARRYSDDTTTKKLTGKSSYTDKKVHNISFKSSGLRYGKVTLTDNAGNKVSMTITVYIDRIKQNLVLRLYSYSNGKKGDKVLKTVTETNYSTGKWVNHAYYFDVSSSTGGSPLTVTLQVNAGGAITNNRDLIDPVYPLVNSSGKPTGHSVAASGNRYVRVIAYDRTHKDTPTVKNVRVYIDTEPPTLTWGDSSVASDGTLKIKYTCKDTLSRLKDAKGNATSSLTETATLQSTGPAKGVCVDRAGNKTISYSSTHYYSESSVCGVDYYKCHYEREYLGVKSDSSCVSEGNVCVDSAGFGKCYCYSSGYTKQVCDEPVYNTCWH